MTLVWIVFSGPVEGQEASVIKGIFTQQIDARACFNNWDDENKDIIEVELNKVYENNKMKLLV